MSKQLVTSTLYVGGDVGFFSHYDPKTPMETVNFQAKHEKRGPLSAIEEAEVNCSDCDKPATGMFHVRNEGASMNDFKHVPRCDLHSLKDHPQAASCFCNEDWSVLIDRERAEKADCRLAGFLLLDKRFAEYPHLHATTNPAGD